MTSSPTCRYFLVPFMTFPFTHSRDSFGGTVGGAAASVKQFVTNAANRGTLAARERCLPGARLPILAFELDDVRARPRPAADLALVDFATCKQTAPSRNT